MEDQHFRFELNRFSSLRVLGKTRAQIQTHQQPLLPRRTVIGSHRKKSDPRDDISQFSKVLLPDRTARPRINVRLTSVVGFVEESCFGDSGGFEGVDVAG